MPGNLAAAGRLLACWLLCAIGLAIACTGTARAGELTRADIERHFPPPIIVGEKEPGLPVWPLFVRADVSEMKRDASGLPVWPVNANGDRAPTLAGYAFESVDIAPVPGYAGHVINMLVALQPDGHFLDVFLVSHHEPIFVSGMGDGPLIRFARQYRNVSVRQTTRVISSGFDPPRVGPDVALLQGVTRGTVSVELLDKSVLKAAIKVAREKLGLQIAAGEGSGATLRDEAFSAADLAALTRDGLVSRTTFTQAQIEAPFAGTPVARPAPASEPGIELLTALVSLPQVGHNLLGDRGWAYLQQYLPKGEHLLLVASRGEHNFVDADYRLAGPPGRLLMRQGGTTVEIRDFVYDGDIVLPEGFERRHARLLRISGYAGIDPGKPLDFEFMVRRVAGSFERRSFDGLYPFSYRIPEPWLRRPAPEEPRWVRALRDRKPELAALAAGLLVLSGALLAQRRLVARPGLLAGFRVVYLLYTLGFIGWFAQAQLSVVQLTGIVEAVRDGHGLEFLLQDPVALVLWTYVLVSLVVWGRGTFCGWLCPFGALQELVSMAGRQLRRRFGNMPLPRPRRLRTALDRRLKWIKYGVLGALLVSAWFSADWTSRGVEVEPFKTAITLYFVRDWPYMVWALVAVGMTLFVYRGYCRYLCPLGAGLAVLGSVRLLAWIPRRAECGTPCQTCRHRCDYQAIEPDGRVDYRECFQCLDCVQIHDDVTQCLPQVVEAKRRRTIPITPVPPVGGQVTT